MARLALNFATAPARRGTALVLLISTAACLHALWQHEHLLGQLEAQQAALLRMEKQASRQAFAQVAHRQEDPKVRAELQQLSAALQRPWEAMLDALQQATTTAVLITRLQPDSDGQRLVVSGEADSIDAFLDYVERLRRQPDWALVEPISQERTAVASSGAKPLSFQLALVWGAQ